jgi:hypothetical protein
VPGAFGIGTSSGFVSGFLGMSDLGGVSDFVSGLASGLDSGLVSGGLVSDFVSDLGSTLLGSGSLSGVSLVLDPVVLPGCAGVVPGAMTENGCGGTGHRAHFVGKYPKAGL